MTDNQRVVGSSPTSQSKSYFNMEQIGTDFQGWPISKLTLEEILQKMGAIKVRDIKGNDILGFNTNDSVLNSYPRTLEDDGMGYGVNEKFITSVDRNEDNINFFIDKEILENK